MVCENICMAPPHPNAMVEDDAFSHKIDYILNLEGHLNRNSGSKVMA